MNMHEAQYCNCPRCFQPGMSVAAMNYVETLKWDKQGKYGLTGTRYKEHGVIQTKRASVFKEPAKFTKPVVGVAAMGMLVAMYVYWFPSILEATTSKPAPDQHDPLANLSNAASGMLDLVGPIIVLMLMASVLLWVLSNKAEEDRLNKEVWPEKLSRYNELRYCERCHVLFDKKGRQDEGSELGFSRMMDYRD